LSKYDFIQENKFKPNKHTNPKETSKKYDNFSEVFERLIIIKKQLVSIYKTSCGAVPLYGPFFWRTIGIVR
jgi:hypothetical protein